MDELIDVKDFLLRVPTWIIVLRDRGSGVLPSMPFNDGVGLPIFTEELHAQKFLNHVNGSAQFELKPLESPLAVLGYMTLLKYKRINYVIIDPDPDEPRRTLFNIPDTFIAEVLRHLGADSDSRM